VTDLRCRLLLNRGKAGVNRDQQLRPAAMALS